MRIKLKYTNNVSLYIEGKRMLLKQIEQNGLDYLLESLQSLFVFGEVLFSDIHTSWKLALDAFSILTVPMNILLFKMYVCLGR